MPKRHGWNTVVLVDGYDISGDSNEFIPAWNIDNADVLGFGEPSHNYVIGADLGKISLRSWFNDGTPSGIHTVLSARKPTPQAAGSAIILGEAIGNFVGAYGWAGTALMSNYTPSSPIGGAVALASDYESHGGLEPVRVVLPKGTIVGTTTVLDDNQASNNGWAAYLQLTQVLGGTPAVEIQYGTTSSGPWGTTSFTASTAPMAELKKGAGTAPQYWRANVSGGSAVAWLAFRRY